MYSLKTACVHGLRLLPCRVQLEAAAMQPCRGSSVQPVLDAHGQAKSSSRVAHLGDARVLAAVGLDATLQAVKEEEAINVNSDMRYCLSGVQIIVLSLQVRAVRTMCKCSATVCTGR
jgi:hypothetical protein